MKQVIVLATTLLVAHLGWDSSYGQAAKPKDKVVKKVKVKKIQMIKDLIEHSLMQREIILAFQLNL